MRWIVRSQNFQQLNVSGSDLVLYPEIGDGKVSNPAEPFALANADRGCGIGMHVHVKVDAQICSQST